MRHTTQSRSGFVHQLAVLGLGLGLAASLTISSTADAASYDDYTREEGGDMIVDAVDNYLLNEVNPHADMEGLDVDRIVEAVDDVAGLVGGHLRRFTEDIAADYSKTGEFSEHHGEWSLDDVRRLADYDWTSEIRPGGTNESDSALSKKLRDIAARLNAIAGALSGSMSKLIGVWVIDPTILAPGYLGSLPPESHGQIISGYGNGAASSVYWEVYDVGGGYESTYSADYGFGTGGMGGEYYDEAEPSGSAVGGTVDDATSASDGDCPAWDENGEAQFSSAEEAWACGVDYVYTEDGSLDWGDDDDSDPESCVPNWRDWYTLENGTLAPDMVFSIADPALRDGFFDELPTIVAGMTDGQLLRITYASAFEQAEGFAVAAPVTQYLQYQEYMVASDLATGASGALVGYTCSANARAVANTMRPIDSSVAVYAGTGGSLELDTVVGAKLLGAVAQ